ncbi:MAG: ATP-dependent DNA helicase [Acidimicrobiales bacterium]
MSADGTDKIPKLEGEAAAAVAHRGGHVQIIAAAGSGKTEVVSQRVASLLADGESPETIVAFTFTEKAAEELKERIRERSVALLGPSATDKLGLLYVGTIHGYCFRLLQTYVPRFETYTPLDSNQLTNLLYREANRLGLRQFDQRNRVFFGIELFQQTVDVVENEYMEFDAIPNGNFKDALLKYYATLDNYRLMSFGTQIVEAVRALEEPVVHSTVTADVKHLIVDEYQDVNPAQERLIGLLAKPNGSADVVVVGDDDQAIYQWRGSHVENIVAFSTRYPDVTTFELLANRRSRPDIVTLANGFGKSIPGRINKEMTAVRPSAGPAVSIAVGHLMEQDEADAIALDIEALHESGVSYRDIAILVRGKTAYTRIIDALAVSKIPVQPGGRTGLFEQSEAEVFGATFAWISNIDWSVSKWKTRAAINLNDLVRRYATVFALDDSQSQALTTHLQAWKSKRDDENWTPSLVAEFYKLTDLLGIRNWNLSEEMQRNRLGTIARFTAVMADYESVTRRSRRDADNPSEQVGGAVGGEWFYKNFALILTNYATGNYDDFDGEDDVLGDGVTLGTIHGAKGLEWPIVFLPSLKEGRFPSDKSGSLKNWLIPRELFNAARYEGSDAEERRLFYVALTRARDWLSLSSHQRVSTQSRQPSPYILEAQAIAASGGLPTNAEPRGVAATSITVSYSELDAYMGCPRSYLLRNELGFMPPVRAEIGFGNAVHHVLRTISEHVKATGHVPDSGAIDALMDSEFYLPFANKAAHKEMREKARALIQTYVTDNTAELKRTWATERPFELYLDGVTISGRADVVFDEHDGVIDNLSIVDYKTALAEELKPLQLQIYTDAGRREGLTVGGAFIQDLNATVRHEVSITESDIAAAEALVTEAAMGLKAREFSPKPEKNKCSFCDVSAVCGAAVRK